MRAGSVALGQQLLEQLRGQGLNPCVLPVGGSNALGTWGYIEAMREIQQQQESMGKFTDIIMVGSSSSAQSKLSMTTCGKIC